MYQDHFDGLRMVADGPLERLLSSLLCSHFERGIDRNQSINQTLCFNLYQSFCSAHCLP